MAAFKQCDWMLSSRHAQYGESQMGSVLEQCDCMLAVGHMQYWLSVAFAFNKLSDWMES